MTGDETVFVVDDDPSVLRAIARLLRMEFSVEAYDSPHAFLEAVRPESPGCILLDLALPGVSGLELQERLLESGCMQPVVFLSGPWQRANQRASDARGRPRFHREALGKRHVAEHVRRALERDREMRTRRNASDSIGRRIASLTPRESEVFRHVIAGRLNKQIAARLGTAEKTIKVTEHASCIRCPCGRSPSSRAWPRSSVFGLSPEPSRHVAICL
jgi:FixJ family two-component response regulator